MSLNKSAARRRLSLMAGSSLLAASFSAIFSAGVALAPTAAFAYDECAPTPSTGTQTDGSNGVSDPMLNAAASDSFTCAVATYASGVRYTSNGDLSVTAQLGTTANFGTGGVVAIAPASPANTDDITLRMTGPSANTLSYSFNTALPALLNAESQAGDVLVEIQAQRTGTSSAGPGITANNAATTRAIRAVSNAGGDVTVRTDLISLSGARLGTIRSDVNANAVAIEARSTGGGDVRVDLGNGTAAGRLYGILAQADGAGAISITGAATAVTSVAGSAGLRVLAGTGPVTIVSGGSGFNGRTGVYVDADGDITFTGAATGTDYGIDIVDVAAGTTATLNLLSISGGIAAVRAAGAGEVLVNLGSASTLNFDFNGMAAPAIVNIDDGGSWRPPVGASTVPAGNFSIVIGAEGLLLAGQVGSGLETPTVVTFSDPAMSLTNTGFIVVGRDKTGTDWTLADHEAELRLVGLGEFRHSGTILLGACGFSCSTLGLSDFIVVGGVVINATDSWYDDMLVFEDGSWIGEGGRILFDVDTNRTQTSCTRNATFDFGAADCLRIVDSTVEGVTYVNVREILAGDRGRLTQQMMDEGILLIDAPGSTVTAENFVLDPLMEDYNADARSLDKGLFQYALLFDEDASQFKLVGTLSGAGYQLPIAATTAHSLWRLSAGSWLERQADLRGGVEQGVGGGVWLRASGEQADRDVINTATLGGLPFSVDSTHQVKSYAVTGGVDLVSANEENMGYVVGLMGGYAHADIEYDASSNTQAMDAWTGGLYASFVSGGAFVDAVVSANNVILDTDAPGFDFLPEGTILSSRLISVGGQVEAGWRVPLGEALFAEPLASVSYVRSRFEDLDIRPDDASRPGLEVSYDDPTSLRASLGGRVGIDQDFGVVRTQLTVLGRVWNEFEGENTAFIHNLAFPTDPDIAAIDDFSGQFNELAVGAAVYSAGGIVSGFLNLGGKFGDDYQARTGSVGVRVAW